MQATVYGVIKSRTQLSDFTSIKVEELMLLNYDAEEDSWVP